jgi:hypothetical protein
LTNNFVAGNKMDLYGDTQNMRRMTESADRKRPSLHLHAPTHIPAQLPASQPGEDLAKRWRSLNTSLRYVAVVASIVQAFQIIDDVRAPYVHSTLGAVIVTLRSVMAVTSLVVFFIPLKLSWARGHYFWLATAIACAGALVLHGLAGMITYASDGNTPFVSNDAVVCGLAHLLNVLSDWHAWSFCNVLPSVSLSAARNQPCFADARTCSLVCGTRIANATASQSHVSTSSAERLSPLAMQTIT